MDRTANASAYGRTMVAAQIVKPPGADNPRSAVGPDADPDVVSELRTGRADDTPEGAIIDERVEELVRGSLDRYDGQNRVHSVEPLRNHSLAMTRLARYAGGSRPLDTEINTSTSLLVAADRQVVEQQLADARNVYEANRGELSAAERAAVERRLETATELYRGSDPDVADDNLERTVESRAAAVRRLADAWVTAERAIVQTTNSSPTNVTIQSRGDPVRNGSEPIARNVSGTVTGVQPANVQSVTVSVNGNRTVKAALSSAPPETVEFTANVTISARTANVTAVATVAPPSTGSSGSSGSSGGGSGGGGGSDGGSDDDGPDDLVFTRELPTDASLTATDTAAFDAAESTAAVSLVNESAIGERLTLRSAVAPDDEYREVRVYESAAAPASYPDVPDQTVSVFDVAVGQRSLLNQQPGVVAYELSASALADRTDWTADAGATGLTVHRYDSAGDEWVSLSTTAEANGETVRVATNETAVVTTSLLALSYRPEEGNTEEPTAVRSESEQPDTVAEPETPTPDVETADPEPETATTPPVEVGSGSGIFDAVDSVIRSINSAIDSITDTIGGLIGTTTVDTDRSAYVTPPVEQAPAGTHSLQQATRSGVGTVKFDGDGVTDTFEQETLGTDPLDPHSDIPSTAANESNDTVVDGLHDPDNDLMVNGLESTYDLEPFNNDTDGDGIADGIETQFPQLNATNADTDGDGVPDGQADPDNDSIPTSDEIDNGTAPFDADTDLDGLDDDREAELGTNPRSADTDTDGLDDADELSLGTDPTVADSDIPNTSVNEAGNGILDGNETFTTSTSNESLNATVSITGEGNVSSGVDIGNGSNPDIGTTETVQSARVSPVVNFESERSFDSANVSISYNESKVSDPSDLAVYRRNETTGGYTPLNSTVDPDTGTVQATTEHFSKFVVFNVTNWQSNYDAVEPPEIEDEASVTPVDATFILDSSGSMGGNDPNDLRLRASRRFVGALIDGDRAGVVDFDSSAQLRQSLTTDFGAVNSSIGQVDSFGGTVIEGGLREALDEYEANSNASRAKIAILLTDGQNGGSNSEVRSQAQRADDLNVTVYTIGFGGANDQLLRDVADTTGGNFTFVSDVEDLPNVFARIANQTGPQDSDGDGLTDRTELAGFVAKDSGELIRTDPFDADTDGDGIPDGQEVRDPVRIKQEVTVTVDNSSGSPVTRTVNQTVRPIISDPTEVDTDNDGLSDKREYSSFTLGYTRTPEETETVRKAVQKFDSVSGVPSMASSKTVQLAPNQYDADGDGLSDGEEVTLGTDPRSADTDGDGMPDQEELGNQEEDPTLFDSTPPTVTLRSIKSVTVGNVVGGPVDAFDTKYIAQVEVRDPAGVDFVAMKKGSTSKSVNETFIDGDHAVITQSVVAESFLNQGAEQLLGVNAKFEVVDENGNGAGDLTTYSGPDVLTTAIRKIGGVLPNDLPFFQAPVMLIGLLKGFFQNVIGGLISVAELAADVVIPDSLTELLVALFVPGGLALTVAIDIIDKIASVAEVVFEEGLRLFKLLAVGVQSSQMSSNPFDLPGVIQSSNGVNTIPGAIIDNIINNPELALGQAFYPLSIYIGTSEYTQFGSGWYGGYIAAFFADKILTAGSSAVATTLPRLSTALSYASKVTSAGAIPTGTGVAVGDVVAIADSVRSGLTAVAGNENTASAFVTGLAEETPTDSIGYMRAVEVAGTLESVGSLPSEFENDEDRVRRLSAYLAATHQPGVDAFEAIASRDVGAADRLLESDSDAQRIVADGQDAGRLSADESAGALATLDTVSDDEDGVLERAVSEGGVEGVRFLDESDPALASDIAAEIDSTQRRPRATGVGDEFNRLVNQAGGRNTSRAVDALGPSETITLLALRAGAAPTARAKFVTATAGGAVTPATADQFLSNNFGDDQVINDLAFSSNTTEAADTIQANA